MSRPRLPLNERLTIGQPAFLVPRTPGCASECWKQPRVKVVGVHDPYVTVKLPGRWGKQITTHGDNVVSHRPNPPADRRPRPPAPRPQMVGGEEIPLW
jgi:hypothetical protein